MLSEGYLKSLSLSRTTNNDLHSSMAGSFYMPGTMLSALRILFHFTFTTACKVESTGLLSHWRVQVQKCHTADLGLNAKSIGLQTLSSQLFSQALIVSEVIPQMLSHLILPNTREVGKHRYYSHCFQTRTEMEKGHTKMRDQASGLQKPRSVTWGRLLNFCNPQLLNLKNGVNGSS